MEYGGYIPAPRVYHAWTKADFDILRQAGLRPVFISTGSDPLADIPAARACGIQPGEKMTLDVEAGWNDTYSANWAGAVHASGYVSELYGLDSEVDAHGQPFDERWRARYVYPQVPTPNPGEAIQYQNSYDANGMTVDKSISNEQLTSGVDDLTPSQLINIKRSMIIAARWRQEDWPADQASVDSFATQILDDFSNYEAVITNVMTIFNTNHQPSLWEQVQALKAQVASLAAPAPDALAAEKALKDVEATIHTDLGA